jgi:hypothetical protein
MIPPGAGFFLQIHRMLVYRYINALSLDVVAGALICSLFFANLFHATLPATALITLGLAVWSVYTLDHLWDAARSPMPSATFRHQFHRQYWFLLMVLVVLAITTGLILIWYLPDNTRKLGALLTLVIAVYFITIRLWAKNRVYHKELLVAMIYCGGVTLAPYSLKEIGTSTFHLLVTSQFVILAFVNLLLFSYFETEADGQQHFSSISRSIGKRKTRMLIIISLGVMLTSAVAGYFTYYPQVEARQSQGIFVLMAIPMVMILIWPDYFKARDRYRFLGDSAFFIPLLFI